MKYFKEAIIVVLVLGLYWTARVHAQSQTAMTIQGGAAHTTCLTPAANAYYWCVATDGIWVSNNGGAYFQIMPPASATAGVTSICVNGCPAGAQSGAVQLKIPSTATSTATVPAVAFSQNGALTLSAPVVTTTIQ